MPMPNTPASAVAAGLIGALQAVPGQRKSALESALSRQPEEEISYCAYLAELVLPRVTGTAKKPTTEAVRLLKQVRAIMDPDLERIRNAHGYD